MVSSNFKASKSEGDFRKMKNNETHKEIKPLVYIFLEELNKHYREPLIELTNDWPEKNKSFPAFLINYQEVTVFVGRTHIAIEYSGSEIHHTITEHKFKLSIHDYSTIECNFLEKIIGFEYDSTVKVDFPFPTFSENIIMPTNKGMDKLQELRWNFAEKETFVIGINVPCPIVQEGHFTRIINGMFFDSTNNGLRSRHIKWLDFIPIKFDGDNPDTDVFSIDMSPMSNYVKDDANFSYPLPTDYKNIHLPRINRFIELWGNSSISEPEITAFLAEKENNFIITMNFGATEVHDELLCEWQSEIKNNIKPDFFIEKPNGYADIVEFKLPDIHNPIVGGNNRESFSAYLNSYISQTRAYESFFYDPNNRKWFEEKYGFKVNKPKRYLVVGRRNDFDSDVWREIVSDYRNIEILTYDDLVDGAVVQFYK